MKNLGQVRWAKVKSFYDGLTLRNSGDQFEMSAAITLNMDTQFPNYEKFWKYHICPATTRPNPSAYFRSGMDDLISVIAQRNYTVFLYMVEALATLAHVKSGDLGERLRNPYITLIYAGNALQVFTELQIAICGSPKALPAYSSVTSGQSLDLFSRLNFKQTLFPDWKPNWEPYRDQIVNYRNYITHQGWLYRVHNSTSREIYVLKSSAFDSRRTYTWTHAEVDYRATPSNWIPIADACEQIVRDTLCWLDRAYGHIVTVMMALLQDSDYQRLWGWTTADPVPSAQFNNFANTTSPLNGLFTGSTSSTEFKPPNPSGVF